MNTLDYLLVALIAAYCLYILLRPNKGDGCRGNCVHCRKKCQKSDHDRL